MISIKAINYDFGRLYIFALKRGAFLMIDGDKKKQSCPDYIHNSHEKEKKNIFKHSII